MILTKIKNYLQERGQASLADIAIHVDSSPDAVRGMLNTWIAKGKVERRMANAACGSSCSKCDDTLTEIYIWRNLSQIRPMAQISIKTRDTK